MTKPTDIADNLEELKPFLEAHHCRTDVIDEAAQLIRELVERERWRPIEDAPKDGTKKLLIAPGWSWPRIGFWSDWNSYWTDGAQDRSHDHIPMPWPTHFRPLPSPPEEGEA